MKVGGASAGKRVVLQEELAALSNTWGSITGDINSQADLKALLGVPPRNKFWVVDQTTKLIKYEGDDMSVALADHILNDDIIIYGEGVFGAVDFSSLATVNAFGQGAGKTFIRGHIVSGNISYAVRAVAGSIFSISVMNNCQDEKDEDIGIYFLDGGLLTIDGIVTDVESNGSVKYGIKSAGSNLVLCKNSAFFNSRLYSDSFIFLMLGGLIGNYIAGSGIVYVQGCFCLTSSAHTNPNVDGIIGGTDRTKFFEAGRGEVNPYMMDNMAEGADTKIMTSAERTKLSGIEAGAEVNHTGAEIKALYEAEPDTNPFTDADKTKLDGLSPSAGDMTKAVYDPTNVNGDAFSMANMAETATKKILTDTERTKLAGISGANTGDETASSVGALINSSGAATLDDTDLIATAEASVLKKTTLSSFKTFLKTYFDTLYQAVGSYASAVHAHVIGDTTGLQTALDGKVDENAAITGATKTKITYDAKGLVTAGDDATTADIADSFNKRYLSDAEQFVLGNTSGTNTGDETATTIGTKIRANAAATMADTDYFAIIVGFLSQTFTLADVKYVLKNYFDTLYPSGSGSSTGTNTGDNAVNSLYSGLVTNATHTGEVTGSGALTLDKTAITNRTSVAVEGTDKILFADASNGDALARCTAQDIANLAGSSGLTQSQILARAFTKC